MEISRRSFIGSLAVLSATGCRDFSSLMAKSNAYSVLVIGDMHYDMFPESEYHSAYPGSGVSKELEVIQRSEFARNGEMWQERIPRLLSAAKRARRDDTAFAIQVGDLIQGDCNDLKVHARMAKDALEKIRTSLGGDLSLRLVVGNHDIRNGANDDVGGFYRSWLSNEMSRECNQKITSANFSYYHGNDLWLHVDFTSPDVDFITDALNNASKARYIFLVTHGPVIPSDKKWYYWKLLGDVKNEIRLSLRKLMMKRNVIVIAGHTHTTELSEIADDTGKITQVIANSVWKEESLGKFDAKFTLPIQYGERQKTEKGRVYLGEYKALLRRYERSNAAGFYRFEISDEEVVAHFYGGDSTKPSVSWKLK